MPAIAKSRPGLWITVALVLAATVALGCVLWRAAEAPLQRAEHTPLWGTVGSPDGRHQIALYGASKLDLLLFAHGMQMPGYVHLLDRCSGRILQKSTLTDLYDNGDVLWNHPGSTRVMVGMDIVFENVPYAGPDTEAGDNLAATPALDCAPQG